MADIDGIIRRCRPTVARALRPAPEVAGERATVPRVPLGERRRELHGAAARRIAAGHLPDSAASRDLTRSSRRTLVYHETVPGHHFHLRFGVENPRHPRFREMRALGGISAMSEGWGLYAERLVAEDGWYDGDPEGLLGQLDAALFRARRLVVDTGLHTMRWTRQQAIDFGIEPSEIERYAVNPGQALLVQGRAARALQAPGQSADRAGRAIQHQGVPQRRARRRAPCR